ncbi:MAG: tetratricopeptide repeat protein [Bryobacterales bacterium]|nr:tetratricopeptide repeat protein [Bryobacterales bacterium]
MPIRQTLLISSALVGLALAPIALSQRASRAELRFQEAHRKETIDGDLKSAIDLYRKAIAEAGSNRVVAAQALVRMGECYEKLGDAEARKAYERVVRDFGDQKDLAETARTRLAALERAGGLSHPPGMTLRKVWALERGWLEGSPSPDGRYHSFHEAGDVFLRDLVTGQNRRLTNRRWGTAQEPGEYAGVSVISGDGKQIAYSWCIEENCEIRVMGIDGSNPRTVFRDKEYGRWPELYQWTADGKQILALLLGDKGSGKGEFALIPAAGGPVRFLKTPTKFWWSASVSPDGRFLVYDAYGEKADESDIFLLPLEGGQEVPLVRSPAMDGGPVWMPDGKKVLFMSDRTGTKGLWTIDVVDGKPQGLPRLLKDGVGRQVRFNGFTRRGDFYFSASTETGAVYVTELDPVEGKILRPPAPIAQRSAGSSVAPSWSPDGRWLAYYSLSVPKGQRAATLMILSVETGEARDVPVKFELVRRPFHVHWFPDGKSVLVGAYASPKRDQVDFYQVDIQTGDHRLVLSSPGPGISHADLSPDGKTLFFYTPGEPKQRGGLISRDIETGLEREIARVPYLAGFGWAMMAVSPDGKHLAFRSPVDEREWTALRLVPAAGGELRELCRFRQSETDISYELTWTPDGRNVLMLRRTGKDGIPELWRIPIAGGEPQRTGLPVEGMGFLSIHPDGRRIAFESGNPSVEARELWVLENILPKPAK